MTYRHHVNGLNPKQNAKKLRKKHDMSTTHQSSKKHLKQYGVSAVPAIQKSAALGWTFWEVRGRRHFCSKKTREKNLVKFGGKSTFSKNPRAEFLLGCCFSPGKDPWKSSLRWFKVPGLI